MVRAEGRVIWVQDQAAMVLGRDGSPRDWQGLRLNITAHEEAEYLLREAEFKHRSLVESNPVVIYSEPFPDSFKGMYMGPRIQELCGYTREEWLADPQMWENLLHPDDRERVLAADARADATGEPFRVEYRWVHRDGRVVWILDECVLVHDEDGGPMFWQGVFIDITERKRIEHALREAEGRYRQLVEQIPAIVYTEAVALGSPLSY